MIITAGSEQFARGSLFNLLLKLNISIYYPGDYVINQGVGDYLIYYGVCDSSGARMYHATAGTPYVNVP